MGDYIKYRAGSIFTGKNFYPEEDSVLLLHKNGRVEAIVPAAEAGDGIQELNGMLCPGFVNTHCHIELSHMKGRIPPGPGMTDFLLSVITQREEEAEQVQQAIVDAEAEMFCNGIVAVGDICNTPNSFPVKLNSALRFYHFIEVTGFVPATAAKRFEAAQQLYAACRAFSGNCSVSPHAPYSVSPELFKLIFSAPQKVVTLHNQESKAESDFFISKTGPLLRLYGQLGIDLSFFQPSGKSSLQTVAPYFRNTESLLLVHNCFTEEEDISTILDVFNGDGLVGQATNKEATSKGATNKEATNKEAASKGADISFCLCPNANLYIGNPLPDTRLLLRSGINICLGTDSLASNNQLSIWEEIKTLQLHAPHLPLATLLQWATLNGARALQMDDELGSFEQGKTPGVLLINPEAGVERLC